jgi:hypothetical protein
MNVFIIFIMENVIVVAIHMANWYGRKKTAVYCTLFQPQLRMQSVKACAYTRFLCERAIYPRNHQVRMSWNIWNGSPRMCLGCYRNAALLEGIVTIVGCGTVLYAYGHIEIRYSLQFM